MEYNSLQKDFEYVKNRFNNKDRSVKCVFSEFEENFKNYNENIAEWSTQISFNGLKEAKNLSKTYIDLDLYLTPASLHIDFTEKSKKKSMLDTFQRIQSNIIVLGQPGAGKTTSMKRIFQQFNNEEFSSKFSFPLLVKLRELKDYQYSIFNFLSKKLNLFFEMHEDSNVVSGELQLRASVKTIKANYKDEFDYYSNFFSLFFNTTKALLIIDGYDEVPRDSLDYLNRELKDLSQKLKTSKFVLTSRSSDYHINLQNTDVFEICPLDQHQLKEFAYQWLPNVKTADDFLLQIKKSPYFDTLIRPLTLSHLCAIYERIGKIPEKPKTVHRKVVSLLIEEWDEQRQIARNSKYQNFEQDRKFEFLANFAFLLTTKFEKTIFSKEQLSNIYTAIYQNFGLPKDDLKDVIKEIESHTGIILCVGQDEYEFTHKSTQEYLTAEYLVRLPNIPTNLRLLVKLPNELALAISLSSSSMLYLQSLLFDRFYPPIKKFFDSGLSTNSLSKSNISQKFDISLYELTGFLDVFCNRIVIEKPDLPITPITTICILIINSLVIAYNAKMVPNSLVRKYCSLNILKNYYDLSGGSNSITYFKKNANAITSSYDLPSELLLTDAQYNYLKNGK
ncbi:NACHT domain-containing protein [Mucilaginibacter sp. AW1-7]|jgi:GTPase SAR1 family protein|uniref:NACHT domain-containing protein n=1 Tax=Mucilaginibacter sp. AW1-7 TaxID=3349874 RepID=UPI003F733797